MILVLEGIDKGQHVAEAMDAAPGLNKVLTNMREEMFNMVDGEFGNFDLHKLGWDRLTGEVNLIEPLKGKFSQH